MKYQICKTNISTAFIKGSSSFLFLFPIIKFYHFNQNYLWKLSNIILCIASYLCNAYDYTPILLSFDYFAICFVGLCYINNIYINVPLLALVMFEYKKRNAIQNTRFILPLSASLKHAYNCHFYFNDDYIYLSISSFSFATVIYTIRYYLIKNRINEYNLITTYLFHICITILLYVSNATIV